jgi:hypothetical protein
MAAVALRAGGSNARNAKKMLCPELEDGGYISFYRQLKSSRAPNVPRLYREAVPDSLPGLDAVNASAKVPGSWAACTLAYMAGSVDRLSAEGAAIMKATICVTLANRGLHLIGQLLEASALSGVSITEILTLLWCDRFNDTLEILLLIITMGMTGDEIRKDTVNRLKARGGKFEKLSVDMPKQQYHFYARLFSDQYFIEVRPSENPDLTAALGLTTEYYRSSNSTAGVLDGYAKTLIEPANVRKVARYAASIHIMASLKTLILNNPSTLGLDDDESSPYLVEGALVVNDAYKAEIAKRAAPLEKRLYDSGWVRGEQAVEDISRDTATFAHNAGADDGDLIPEGSSLAFEEVAPAGVTVDSIFGP